MKKSSLIVLLLCGFLLVAVIAEASDLFGTIKLKGQPLPNAGIILKDGSQEQRLKTNEQGYYSIRNLEPGKYTITIQLQDESTREATVHVFPQNTEKNIDLK
ncbi:MAG: carboxypeptidase regulatory-like domain-containing protein [Nitrospirae bacterium]|nr:carboxypeptidase regulatory-like domain-containing protein [Nitrospirota bacterium]